MSENLTDLTASTRDRVGAERVVLCRVMRYLSFHAAQLCARPCRTTTRRWCHISLQSHDSLHISLISRLLPRWVLEALSRALDDVTLRLSDGQ